MITSISSRPRTILKGKTTHVVETRSINMNRAMATLQQLALLWTVTCLTNWYTANASTADAFCKYKGDVANCSGFGNNLTFIPPVRNGSQQLIFDNDYLPYVSSATFRNITTNNISLLDICCDNIEYVTPDAFDSFTGLEQIGLAGNKIPAHPLKVLLGHISGLPRLRKLVLDNLSLEPFPGDLFSDVRKNRITGISLMKNNIVSVNKTFFLPLKYLEYIDLRQTALYSIYIPVLTHLQILHLDKNKLKRIPDFCVGNSSEQSVAPSLRHMYLKKNRISQVSNSVLRCLPSLRTIDLAGNYIGVFPNNMLSKVPNLQQLDIRFLEVRFPIVQPHAFQSNSLKYLSISNSINVDTLFASPNETFRHSPNLIALSCDDIGFDSWTDDKMAQMLSSLVKLESVSFRKCQINFTPIKLLQTMPNLKRINLALNEIKDISPLTFSTNKHIEYLYLDANKITHVKETVLPASLLSNLKLLSMKFNPYACDCDLEYFIQWLKKANNGDIKLKGYPKEYVCASPSGMTGVQLSDVSFTYRQCHPWGPAVWMGVIGGPSVVVIIIIAVFTYRNRWSIKHYVYLLRRRKQYNLIEGRNYLYDAFVAYSEHDRQWVIKQLLPELENKDEYKLCIHDRDFKPGMYINDNISARMDESRSIVVVLSDEFITSGWCRFEMKVAHARHIEDNIDLIVVVLKMPRARHVSKELKTLLHSTTYIEWTDNVVGQQLFWSKLKDAMKQ